MTALLGAKSGQPIPAAMLAKDLSDRIDKSGDCWVWTGLRTSPSG
jgi:hypothetical protein